jgi:hypothetical protein
MRTRLTLAIIVVLILLVLGSSLRRSGKPSDPAQRAAILHPQSPEIVEIKPTREDIEKSRIVLFDPSGKPLVGYVQKGTNEIALFSVPSGPSPKGDVISPITRDKIEAYFQMLERQAADEKKGKEIELAKARERELIEKIEAERAEEERKRMAASNATVAAKAELAAYRKRYIALNTSFDHNVLIVNEKNSQSLDLSSLVAESLQNGDAQITTSFFRPAFVTDGLFEKAFTGQADELQRLPIKDGVQTISFGRQSVSYTKNPDLGVITANMALEMNVVRTDGFQSLYGQTIKSIGAGLSEEEARSNAEAKIVAQLTNGVTARISKVLSRK